MLLFNAHVVIRRHVLKYAALLVPRLPSGSFKNKHWLNLNGLFNAHTILSQINVILGPRALTVIHRTCIMIAVLFLAGCQSTVHQGEHYIPPLIENMEIIVPEGGIFHLSVDRAEAFETPNVPKYQWIYYVDEEHNPALTLIDRYCEVSGVRLPCLHSSGGRMHWIFKRNACKCVGWQGLPIVLQEGRFWDRSDPIREITVTLKEHAN